jgi:hypothetical protein
MPQNRTLQIIHQRLREVSETDMELDWPATYTFARGNAVRASKEYIKKYPPNPRRRGGV